MLHPNPPQNLKVSNITSDSAVLEFEESDGAQSYVAVNNEEEHEGA